MFCITLYIKPSATLASRVGGVGVRKGIRPVKSTAPNNPQLSWRVKSMGGVQPEVSRGRLHSPTTNRTVEDYKIHTT